MYQPPKDILKKYAQILVKFALNSGQGIKKGDVVRLQFDSPALPLALETYKQILNQGGMPMVKMNEEEFERLFFQLANQDQLTFFPKKYSHSLVETINHSIYLLANRDPFYLKNVPVEKITLANQKRVLMRRWLNRKEDQGKFTWTLALYGTPGLAAEARLSLKAYWEQIIKACFLDKNNPLAKWREVFNQMNKTLKKLNQLAVKRLHLIAKDTDLWIGLGEKRKWIGGSGRNIPSFEIFTSPDWRLVEGKVFFDFPLYRYGNIIEGIYLEFRQGKIIKLKAMKNEKLLREIIRQKNADRIGEYSLTDRRFSRIDKFMATTLFDENFGGQWGNTHLAVGASYHDTYQGEPSSLTKKDWADLGFNESAEHCDIIAKQNRRVEAELSGGVKKIIYENGQFTI